MLTVAGIFGPNAAGKTNVIAALQWLQESIGVAGHFWRDAIPRTPHAGAAYLDKPSSFELDFVLDGTRHTYLLEVLDGAVHHENLEWYPQGCRKQVFERNGQEITFETESTAQPSVQKTSKPQVPLIASANRFPEVEPSIRNTAAALTSMTILNDRQLHEIAKDGNTLGNLLKTRTHDAGGGCRPEDDPGRVQRRNRIVEMARMGDPTIRGYELVETGSGHADEIKIEIVHEVAGTTRRTKIEDESSGTRAWLQLVGPVLNALETGTVLVVDDIDTHLHPALTEILIRTFHDRIGNPRNAQLLFTAHDSSLLDELTPDEAWIAESDPQSETKLAGLAEFNMGAPREPGTHRLATAYRNGRFGGVPNADTTSMRRLL